MTFNIPTTIQTALQHYQAGRLSEAEALFRRVLQAEPNNVHALHFLGVLAYQQGKYEHAVNLIGRAIKIDPGCAETHNSLGVVLHEQDRYAEAIAQYQRALALKPDYAEAHNNLGVVLMEQKQLDKAEEHLRRALALKPNYAEAHYSLGNTLRAQEKREQAVSSYQRALQLGLRTAFDAGARHTLASFGLAPMPTTAAPEYVAKLFDEYANRFDKNLVEDLEYRGPQQLHHAVRQAAGPGERQFDVIDLGCGTGLCGPLFRDLARTLVGVDLSPKMIEKTRARNVYDRLMLADIATALREPGVSYDLILAADVFIYVGELTSVFEACRTALRPGGLFAFSIEAEEQGESYTLRTSGRYAHSIGYVRKLAQAYGLKEISLDQVVIRKEKGNPLPGYIFLLECSQL